MKDKLLFKKMMQEGMKEGMKEVLRLSDFLSCIIIVMELTRTIVRTNKSKQKG